MGKVNEIIYVERNVIYRVLTGKPEQYTTNPKLYVISSQQYRPSSGSSDISAILDKPIFQRIYQLPQKTKQKRIRHRMAA